MELENMLGRRPTGLRVAVRDALQMQAQHSTQLS
jgi:hypothetical protein